MKTLKLITAISIMMLSGCRVDKGVKEVKTTNTSFDVELLFEVDSCKVYRFRDCGEYRYFTTCQGSLSWSEYQGKRNVNIEIPTSAIQSNR